MIFTAVIIEDEVPARETIKGYLSRYFENIVVIHEIDNVMDSISFLANNKADIIFLDVQLKDGQGVDILNKMDTSKYKIVFTTAHDKYTFDAFKHKSFGYLLKPIDPDDFKEIVTRILNDLKSIKSVEPKKIKIPINSGNIWIEINDIIRCEAENNYTRVFVNDHKSSYVISKTLKTVENEVVNSDKFVRVHQSHLINLNFIAELKIQNNKIQLINGDSVPVSRSNKDFLNSIANH